MTWLELDDPATLPGPGRAASWRPGGPAIRVGRRYRASAQRAFDAWLDPESAGTWLFAKASRPLARVEIDPRADGAFCFAEHDRGAIIEHTGDYLEITPPRHLIFRLWLQRPFRALTRVSVDIAPLQRGCELRLTHEDVPEDCAEEMEARWAGILYGLGVTLDPDAIEFHNHQE
jgi:uncharacterized protein YndB with AHSA1/START domain